MRYGTVIVFPEGHSREDAEDIIRLMENKGWIVRGNTVYEYDPEIGEPVWYIP